MFVVEIKKQLDNIIYSDQKFKQPAVQWPRKIISPRSKSKELETRKRFEQLALKWRKETSFHSSIDKKIFHPAYREIVEMGDSVVPFLLQDLAKKPDHWFEALSEITGENPIPEEASGIMDDMAKAWLDWARKNNV
jgi:hypothetical protein